MSSKTLRRVLGVLAVFTAIFAVLSVKTQAATNEDVKPIVYDAEYYITTAKDLQDAYIREDGSVDEEGLYGQFVVYGIAEGRKGSPSFDIKYYMETNPDLAKEFGATNYARGYQHFLEYGLYEGRTGCNLYDNASYKAYNPDLVTAYGNANEMYYVHFVLFGQGEGRKACDWFDVKCYVNSNADLKKEFGTNWKAGYKHYAFFGNSENRIVAHTWEDGVCATCGEKQAPTEHVHVYVVNEEESIPATCTLTGRKVEVCSCGDRKESVVPALGHDYVEATEEQLASKNLSPATCTKAGTSAKACSRCGDLVDVTGVDALGHEYTEWRTLTDEEKTTYSKNNYAVIRTCSRCNVVEGEAAVKAFNDATVKDLTVTADAIKDQKTLTVPAGTTRKIEGRLAMQANGKITIEGNLILDSDINSNPTRTVEVKDGATVTYLVDDESDLDLATREIYVTDAILRKDVDVNSKELKIASDIVIDLNNHAINGKGEVAVDIKRMSDKDAVVTLKNGVISGSQKAIRTEGNLVVEDCNIKATSGYGVYAKGPNGDEDKITVELKNVKMTCSQYCVSTNATQDNVDLTLTNVVAYSNKNTHPAVYLPAKGNTVISGGEFTGTSAIECVASNLEIKDGAKLSGTKVPYEKDAHDQTGGSYATGSALILTSRGGGYSSIRDVITVKISEDVEFKYSAQDPAFNVEFIENQVDTEGASYDITWEGHVWSDVHKDVSNNLTINFVNFNGEKVLGN